MPSRDSGFESTFSALISLFTLYYFVEQCLRYITTSYNPGFYEKLRASRKDLVFFGIAMGACMRAIIGSEMFILHLGLLITALSTPSCAYAALDAWKSTQSPLNDPEAPWRLGNHARVCIAARGVLWVSELNRLDMYGLYVLHHAGSIIALLSWLQFQWPNLVFLTLFTTLVSEIPGDLVYMVSAYKETVEASPKLDRFRAHLVGFNAVQYALIRGGGILTVSGMLARAPGIQGRPVIEQLYAYGLLGLYTAFCASYVLRQRNSIRKQASPSGMSTPQQILEKSATEMVRQGK